MDTNREKVYLAALLHDIGKFYQRADKSFNDKQNCLSVESKKIADYLCPLNEQGNFGYQHCVWTHQFLQDQEKQMKQVPGLVENVFEREMQDSVFQLTAFHHKPSTELQALISMADWWSAGIDRRTQNIEVENGERNGVQWGNQRYKKIPLYSVFNKISTKENSKPNYQFAFGLHPLSIDEKDIYPSEIKNMQDGVDELKYAALWKSFVEEFKNLPTDSFDGFAESLMFLLKKYTWCIPSNTTDMANVSLFDHLKTAAAFADSLYVYKTENPDAFLFDGKRLSLKEGVSPVMLLGGDLSGIQKFIYNIASRKAAVSLKGRSFYLQLLIDSIIQRVISHSDIQATLAHVVYSSGGTFYMILPNTAKVRNAIEEIRLDTEKELWDKHSGQLIVNIDYIPFAYNVKEKGLDFCGKNNQPIGELWRTLAEKLQNHKNQKFKTLLTSEFDKFFNEGSNKVGGETKVCAVTGIESTDCVPIDSNEDEKTWVLPIVEEQAKLGKTLKDADYILTHKSSNEQKYIKNRVKFDLACMGVHSYLFDQLELTNDDADFRKITSADVCRVKTINKINFLGAQLKGQKCSYGFQFYGGNKQAQILDKESQELRNKTFEELADNSYLGVLRMDVDNLGSIFIRGLPDEDKSFAAYSTLSFMLDWFFSGFLNTIRDKDEFKDDVNVLYSGGDDIFAVGRWDKLILFAETVRNCFQKFVGRDDISISGGISIVSDKYPIAKAAEMAGDSEDAAKKYNNFAKNAFNMFGESVAWTKEEFDYVKKKKKEMVELCSSPTNMPRSILHKLMQFNEMRNRGEISYIWNTAYFLKRFSTDKKNDAIISFCECIQNDLLNKNENYRFLALACRWAELELREK